MLTNRTKESDENLTYHRKWKLQGNILNPGLTYFHLNQVYIHVDSNAGRYVNSLSSLPREFTIRQYQLTFLEHKV